MASNFPQEIDNILEFKDLTSQDLNAVKRYQNAMQSGDMQSANNALKEILDYQQKIISAERLNQIRDAILAVEEFYGYDIEYYIDQKQAEWESIINKFSYKGDYSDANTYEVNNIVSYTYNGLKQLYICIKNTIAGTLPTNETYWRVLTIKGEDGLTNSENTTFSFDWISSQTYAENTITVYDDKWWLSKRENLNKIPPDNPDDWELVLEIKQAIYPVQSEEPSGLAVGEIWFEVI